jgi:hypothetical protein
MPRVQIKRGTLTQLQAAATANQLLIGEQYLITNTGQTAVATSASTFELIEKRSNTAKLDSANTFTQDQQFGSGTQTTTVSGSGLVLVNSGESAELNVNSYRRQDSTGNWNALTHNTTNGTASIAHFDGTDVIERVLAFTDQLGGGGVSLGETSTTAYRGDRGKTAYDTVTGSQSANRFFASPNGSAGAPSYRSILSADLPSFNTLNGSSLFGSANLVCDFLSGLSGDEVAITGAATLQLGSMNVCSGTGSYTVAVPTAVGNYKRCFGIRMATSLSGIVTADGFSSQTLGGELTRPFWAGEMAVFMSDGANWIRLGGTWIPFSAKGLRNSGATITNGSPTKLSLNSALLDSNSLLVNTTTGRITVQRKSRVSLVGAITYENLAPSNNIQARIHKNGDAANAIAAMTVSNSSTGGYPGPMVSVLDSANPGDYYELFAYQTTGGAVGIYTAQDVNWLSFFEVSHW